MQYHVVEKQSLHCLSSDPNVRKEWNSSVRTLSFVHHRFFYKQSTIWGGIFRKSETKRLYCADYIGSDTNVAIDKCEVTAFNMCSLLLRLLQQIINIYWVFNHSSFHIWGMYAVKHTQVLANHSRGYLHQSLQSAMPIQTERSDEGV